MPLKTHSKVWFIEIWSPREDFGHINSSMTQWSEGASLCETSFPSSKPYVGVTALNPSSPSPESKLTCLSSANSTSTLTIAYSFFWFPAKPWASGDMDHMCFHIALPQHPV